MQTIREIIKEKSAELREIEKLGPAKAAEELVQLSSLLASLNTEIVETQFILNQKRSELLLEAKSVAKARLLAEGLQEWHDWFERIMQRDALLELIRALKYYLRAISDERRESAF